MKLTVTSILILFFSFICSSQNITYNWNSFTSGGTSYSNTQNGGCTMNTNVSGANFINSSPKFDNAVGTNGVGLMLDQNWANISNETVITSNFSPALSNPSFVLYDINRNPTTSDFCSNAWTDSVFVSAVGATAVSVSQSQPIQQTTQIVGTSVKIVANAVCNQTTQGSVTISFTGPVTQITIKYLSGRIVRRCSTFSPCGSGTTPTCTSPVACSDPGRQFITIGNITGTSCCTTTSPPSSISGNTGPFCGPTTTTLTAAGAASNSQWHTGSCTGPIIGSGTSIAVTPAATTTYYVNNLDCNNNPTSCVAITVTVNPIPVTPSISNTGLSICTGNTTTLTSSSASGNTWSTGSTAQSIVVSAAGTYTLRVSSGGCLSNPASVTVNTVSPPPAPTISAGGPTTFCAGGSVVLSSSNASNNTWNTGATTQTILVSSSGTFSVASGSGSCTSSSNLFTVTVLPNPSTPSITSTGNSLCSGETATLTSSSTTGNTWSNGSTAQTTTVNATGTYSLFVTGANSCKSPTTSVNVTVTPAQPTPTVTANGPTTFCAGGSVVLSSSNASGNAWNTGATTQTILVTTAGNYSVVSGIGTCSASSNVFNVNVNPLPNTPSITASGNNLCSGQSAILSSSSSNNNQWNTGATSNTIQVNSSGVYSLTIVDANNCSSPTATIAITINTSTLNVLVPQNVLTCNGAITPSFDFTSTATNATYVWNNTEPSIGLPSTGIGFVPSFTATNNGNGIIEAIITVTPSADGCSGLPESFTISVNPAFVINAGVNDTICFGESTTLNAQPNISTYSYNWQPSAGLNNTSIINPIANPSITTNYTLTVTDVNGCSGKDVVSIFTNTEILSTLSATNTLCFNSCDGRASVVASGGNGPYQYSWSNGSSTAMSNSLCEGNYSVTVTDSWQCSKTNTVQIQEPQPLVASILSFSNTICHSSCDGLATGTASGGTGTYNYSWNTVPSQNNITAANLCAGTYQLKVTDGNNCKDSVNVTISQPVPIILTTNPDTEICNGSSATLTTSIIGGTPGYSYTWSPGTNGNSPMISVTPSVNTTYSVIVRDSRGCLSNIATVGISIKAPLTISANNATICLGSNTIISTVPSGGIGTYTINWSPGTGLGSTNGQNIVANPSVTTVYSITINDGCSTTSSSQVTVNVLPVPVVSIASTASVGCAPLCVTLTDNSIVSNGTIVSTQWNIAGLGSANTPTANYCFDTPGNYSVSVTATSLQGCSTTVVFPNYITIYPNPVADFEMPTNVSILNPLVQFTDQSIGATSWNWNFGDQYSNSENQTSTAQNPSHFYENQGTYCVNLMVTNIHGCVGDTTKCLDILPEFTIYVPNAFTPDEDNLNDVFTAIGINIIEFEMYIFDRWGEEIYHTKDITKGWDGKVKNGSQIAKQDVYVWKITAKDIFEDYHYLTGHVTLIKKED